MLRLILRAYDGVGAARASLGRYFHFYCSLLRIRALTGGHRTRLTSTRQPSWPPPKFSAATNQPRQNTTCLSQETVQTYPYPAVTPDFQAIRDGGDDQDGRRQSMPSHSIASCAAVKRAVPSAADGQGKRRAGKSPGRPNTAA
jgi:hypothetical protein